MSKSNKHTPGPWSVSVLEDETSLEIEGSDSRNILSCLTGEFLDATDKANAALIASAPDMLLTLETLLFEASQLSFHKRHLEMLRTAINKAKGEL